MKYFHIYTVFLFICECQRIFLTLAVKLQEGLQNMTSVFAELTALNSIAACSLCFRPVHCVRNTNLLINTSSAVVLRAIHFRADPFLCVSAPGVWRSGVVRL